MRRIRCGGGVRNFQAISRFTPSTFFCLQPESFPNLLVRVLWRLCYVGVMVKFGLWWLNPLSSLFSIPGCRTQDWKFQLTVHTIDFSGSQPLSSKSDLTSTGSGMTGKGLLTKILLLLLNHSGNPKSFRVLCQEPRTTSFCHTLFIILNEYRYS